MGKMCDSCRRAGRVFCPHNAALEIRARLAGELRQEMFGPTPPNLFVGHSSYPNVYWGPLVSAKPVEDEPSKMYGMSLERIIEARASMVRGMKRGGVKEGGRLLEEAQLSVMSIKPIDAEVKFSKKPVFSLEADEIAHPVGASAPIERFRVADNPVVPKRVDELHEEGVLAEAALRELLIEGFDVHYLSKLLTAGILGREGNRKLVPTKWAITATDDIAGRRLIESIRGFRPIEEARVYSNTYLDNHFEILLLPGNWEYEQFEAALAQQPKGSSMMGAQSGGAGGGHPSNISEEYEPFSGRSMYAESQGGGYYAARFGVAEALYKMRRQARCVVFREIGAGYSIPVGVWEVRENVRHAFANKPMRFGSKREALEHLSGRLSLQLKEYLRRSRVLLQGRLTEF
jgi:hypothetical protein